MDFDENIQVENLQVENFLDCQFIKTEKYIYTLMPLVVLQNPELFKITTKLIDLDYTGFCDKQVLQMIQDFKQSYIPKS